MANVPYIELVQNFQGLSLHCAQDAFNEKHSQAGPIGLQFEYVDGHQTDTIDHMDIDVDFGLAKVSGTNYRSSLDRFRVRKTNARTSARHKQKDKECSSLRIKKRALQTVQMRNLARAAFLTEKLAGRDLVASFAYNCERTLGQWVSLLRLTTLPVNTTSSDSRILTAFQKLDSIISGHGLHLLRRLAHVQLMKVFSEVESIIQFERDAKQMHREPSYRNSSIAIDIYMNAQDSYSDADQVRRGLKERKRISSRWSSLAVSSSPLFVLLYGDSAEPVVYVCLCYRRFPSSG